MKTRGFLLVGLLACACNVSAIPAYEFGVGLNHTVTPGSIFELNAAVKNTGDTPFYFPVFQNMNNPGGGFAHGGDFIANFSAYNFTFGTYDTGLHGLVSQFTPLALQPGQTFNFVIGSVTIPEDSALGTAVQFINLDFSFISTDGIRGTLRALGLSSGDILAPSVAPDVTVTVGESDSSDPFTWTTGRVYRHTTDGVPTLVQLSGPGAPVETVPDAGSTAGLLALCCLGLFHLRRSNCSNAG